MTKQFTDQQLKKALGKMLPDRVIIYGTGYLCWKGGTDILDSELLHLCWLVENTLMSTLGDKWKFLKRLNEQNIYRFDVVNAPWQQRVIALCNVKGVEIV